MTAEIADASLSEATAAGHVIVELSCGADTTAPTDALLTAAVDAAFTGTNGAAATTLYLNLGGCGAVSATDGGWVGNLAANSILNELYFVP